MSSQVRVGDLRSLTEFRPALIRFSEEVLRALSTPGSDAGRVLTWLQQDRLPHWKREIRILSEEAVRANSALVQQTSSQNPRPSVDARKAYELAKRRVRAAEEKYEQTRRQILKLQKAVDRYRASVQPMATIARADMTNAVGRLDGYIKSLDEYTKTVQHEGGPHAKPSTKTTDDPGDDTDTGGAS